MKPKSRIRSWPNSTFRLDIEVEHDRLDKVKHVWVHLYREAPGRHGRLKVMHGIVPTRKRPTDYDKTFLAPSFRLGMIRSATEVLLRAGVTDKQAREMMSRVAEVYPVPTPKELWSEQVDNPLISLVLGERRSELSYFETGVPVMTKEDIALVEKCWSDLDKRMKTDKKLMAKFSKIVLGPRMGSDGF